MKDAITILILAISTETIWSILNVSYWIKRILPGVDPRDMFKPIDCGTCMAFWFGFSTWRLLEAGIQIPEQLIAVISVPFIYQLINRSYGIRL